MNELIRKRKEDAEAILKQYVQIGDISKSRCFDGLADRLEIKNVLVLTNSDYILEDGLLSHWDDKHGAVA